MTTVTATPASGRFVPADMTAPPIYDHMTSPIGELLLTGDGQALTGLHMLPHPRRAPAIGRRAPAAFGAARQQLESYFAGELTCFDVPLAPRGTDFQLEVWAALLEIPYGETSTYGEIARAVGRPTGSRAVGAANGRNPIAVIIPCHRVIGAAGALVGYGGGLDRKRVLLDLEQGRTALL